MIDDLGAARPQSGLSSRVGRLAGARPRAASRATWRSSRTSCPTAIGPVRSARYYYIAWAAEWRAVYAHVRRVAAGARDAPRPRAAASTSTTPTSSATAALLPPAPRPASRRTTCTRAARSCASSASRIGAKDKAYKPVWQFAPDAPLERAPVRRHDHGQLPVQHDHATSYDRKTNTYLRSVTGEKKQIDAADGKRVAPKNVVVMRMRSGRSTTASGAPRSRPTSSAAGTAWISTNGRTIKGTWKKTAMTKPTRFYDADGKRSR